MKIILGSGIIGMLARELLGSDWTVIPFSRSRFYSFKPALVDNFIVRDEKIDDFMLHLGGKPSTIIKTSYSYNGALYEDSQPLREAWLGKVFDTAIPPHASVYMQSRGGLVVYNIAVNDIYNKLQSKYINYLKEESEKGKIEHIGDHYLIRNGQKIEFDNLISTIPLNALLKLCNVDHNLESRPLHVFHIATSDLDFEGATRVLIVDSNISIISATNVAPNRYVLHSIDDIPVPGPYFMQFMRRFDILDGTAIEEAIPTGEIPNIPKLAQYGIECVGSLASWDWCMDVGSCMIKLLKYKLNI